MLRPEKEPVLPFCPSRLALLQISTEGCHSGPWPDHDDWNFGALGQMKMFCHTRINWHRYVVSAFRKKGRANTFTQATVTFVANHVDNKVNLVGIGLQA